MSIKIEDLRIGQFVYFENMEHEITALNAHGQVCVSRVGHGASSWENVEDISLEPPKQKVKRWLWAEKWKNISLWEETKYFLTEEELQREYKEAIEKGAVKFEKLEWSEQEFLDG